MLSPLLKDASALTIAVGSSDGDCIALQILFPEGQGIPSQGAVSLDSRGTSPADRQGPNTRSSHPHLSRGSWGGCKREKVIALTLYCLECQIRNIFI